MNPVYKHFFLRISRFIFIIILLLGGTLNGLNASQDVAKDSTCITQGWPHDNSDLQPDPGIIYGSLENGFRYVIMENHEPENRTGLYLNIQAGSLRETDEQRGLAHFLEHMLFNGTTNYPPGTLVKYFQSIGMSFGSDTNAHTNFNETVYNILLPDGDRQHLDEGLLVMADYARGALLLEDEVDRERGIILAEKRTRDSVGYRLYKQKTQFFFAGTRVTERLPIGTEETLQKANAELLRHYYDSWYRPENTILIVVGDVNPEIVKELIDKHFGIFKNPENEPACFNFGRVEVEGTDVLYVHEPELGYTEVSVSTRWNEIPTGDSIASQSKELEKYVSASLLNNRLKKIVNQPDSPITSSQIYSGVFLQRVGYATVTARTETDKWREGLELLNITLRQALESGFTKQELVRVKKEIAADLDKQVKTEGSRDSRKLAGEIINKLNNNQVFLSPEQELRLYSPLLESLTVDDVNRIFRALWSHDNRQVFVGGTADITGSSRQENVVRQVYLDSQARKLPEWKNGEEIAFPYLSVPDKAGVVTEKKDFPGIDALQVRFENGTVLNIKNTDFQQNEVLLSVHFGQGRLTEPEEGLAMLSEAVIRESGYGRLTKDKLEEALAGSSVGLSFNVGQESFQLSGKGLSSEFELLMQLVHTQLLDPAFREEAYRLSKERFNQMYDQKQSSVDGMMQLAGERFLAGGNNHYGEPPKSQFNDLKLSQVIQWLTPVFKNAQLEVTVVGDISTEKVIALTGRYLGSLERETSLGEEKESITFPSGRELAKDVNTQIDKALVIVAWPTDDFWDIARTRRLNVLSS
ncbi:MAG: insulinase family protein, partial [Desulfobulbaceae bacterium]|nr:insulinase family protein [Desulfobulbaceae bacterium]